MRNRWMALLAVAALAGALHTTNAVAEDEGGEKEVKVDLKDVPENVKKAATDAVKGLVLTEAEKETKASKDVYELEGKVGDKKYEVVVDADGKVLKSGEDDEGENEDDDDDDDAKTGAEKRGEKHKKSGKKQGEEKSEKNDD
ncbi:MAG: PepSY domain-containing protein [Planctomycetes bacterium]|nr:PepSY domain-containing protein [Planctomycetota bacterium]